eukprot:CAMPEP_0119121420 /NCGR_PEP_ID=MMETSP1310-20130426/2061_1 /TAXON_ID=464262 /ORGANISM="Genus nov. species nov., Strain RCC2339" /LENGTH=634 /DNA_ID=CAMNT_0007110983 /DNA_START=112 /DNA_END=2016 /DNA_ORIENTATION=-
MERPSAKRIAEMQAETAKVQEFAMSLMAPGGRYEVERASVLGRSVLQFKSALPNLGELYAIVFAEKSRLFTDGQADNDSEVFLVYGKERYSYSRAIAIIADYMRILRHDLGVGRGDRVGVCMRNYPEWIWSFIAVTWLGAAIVPLNAWWKDEELRYGYQNAGISVLVCDLLTLHRSRDVLLSPDQPVKHVVVARRGNERHWEESSRVRSEFTRQSLGRSFSLFHELVPQHAGLLPATRPLSLALRDLQFATAPDDTAAIFFTSGSTGHPKGVDLTHRGTMQQMEMARMSSFIQSKLLPPPEHRAAMVCSVPLFHVTGCHHVFLSTLLRGGKLVLMEKWSPKRCLRIIHDEKITSWSGVPTMVSDMVEAVRVGHADGLDLSSLGFTMGGGAQFASALARRAETALPKSEPAQGYGLTETSGAIAVIRGDLFRLYPTSTGQAFPIAECAIVNDHKRVRDPAQEGELWVKSSLIMKGYWNNTEATNKAIVSLEGDPGWFRTGDICKMDKDGFLYIVDRKKEIIIRGGENISCLTVEAAVYHHEAVTECAAFAIKDDRLGERVGLIVLLKPHYYLSARELVKFLVQGRELASFEIPEADDIFFTSIGLPRTASGKIAKKQIRAVINDLLSGATPHAKL